MDKFDNLIGHIKPDKSYFLKKYFCFAKCYACFGATRIKGDKTKLKRGRETIKQPIFLSIYKNRC